MYYYRQGSGVTGSFNDKYFDLKQVWNEIYGSAKKEYPQYLEWAKVNKARINFTLLSELALSKEYESGEYKAKREELIKELKKNRRELIKSGISWTRKVLMLFYCANYSLTARIISRLCTSN